LAIKMNLGITLSNHIFLNAFCDGYFYDKRVAMLAGIISGIGYIGFSSSQNLAGAKLASAKCT
ncbi:MAG: hypothetical protein ACP5DZ_11085, partial [Bacteroidales bacterium]